MRFIDGEATFGENADGLYIHHSEAISSDFLDMLKSERHAKDHIRAANFDRVASVPPFLVELWNRQGYDFYNMSAAQIVAKLNADDLGAFITTSKSV